MRVWTRERLWVQRRLPQQFIGIVAASAMAGLVLSGSAMPKHEPSVAAPKVSPGVSVPIAPVTVKKVPVRNEADNVAKATEITWPTASSVSVRLEAAVSTAAAAKAGRSAAARPGALGPRAQGPGSPVWLQAVAGSKGIYTGPTAAQIKVLPHSRSAALGVAGEVFTVSGASSAAGQVKVGLDYQGFAQEYGGNYGSRLSLVELPACALTTPQVAACRKETPLHSLNQAVTRQLSATVALGGSGRAAAVESNGTAPKRDASVGTSTARALTMVLAATSSAGTEGGAAGTYAATSLKPSSSWNEGGDSGSYDYSYPVTVPDSSSSLAPTVGLSYDSQSVDGQTSVANAQSSWVGDGWDTPDSFIEQTFTTCSDDPEGVTLPSAEATGDECYDGPILTVSLDGSSTSLVCNAAESACTEQADDGAVVTHVTDSSNGTKTYNTDYWEITERDGTTYYFGLNELPGYVSGDKTTNSVDYEPVYSANSGDPCYSSSGFTDSVCTMAYRWHLDYVTNATGQAMSYSYTQTTNEYGEDNGAKDVSYVSDSYLAEIDYGFAAGGEYGTVPDKVEFTPNSNGRCVQSSCTSLTSSSMTATLAATDDPDVPYDLICGPGTNETTCTSYSPSFFSVNSLSTIETYQYSTADTAYEPVDLYTLTQTEPTTGDTTNSTLWLESIQHEGMDTSAGASSSGISMPSETFSGTDLANRVDAATFPALYRYRLTGITSELGAQTTITYTTPDTCSDTYVTDETAADAETNTESCYPVNWQPDGYTSQILDWFNSYAVSQVIVKDTTGGSMSEETDYTYGGGAAWHYDDDEVVKAQYRTYGQFRGYATVATYNGQVLNNPQTEEVDTYYRGMDGDWSVASGGTVSATVKDSLNGVHTDSEALAGDVLESRQYLGAGGPLENDTITSYWVSGAVQTRARSGMDDLVAQMSGTAEVYKSQTDSDGGETGVSTATETDTTYDATSTDADFGLPTFSYAHTVPVNTAYDSCTTTEYAPANTSENLVGLVSYTETDQAACSGFSESSNASVPSGLNALGAPSSVSASEVGSATETFYDDPTFSTTFPQTAAPTKGLATMVRQAVSGTPGSFTWQTEKQETYDSYGRVADKYDADGNETATSYTVNSVGLTTGETVTAPTVAGVAHTTSQTFDPTRDLALTSTDDNGIVATETYDALGRLVDVWKDGRASTLTPSIEYAYTVSNTGISGVTTQTLNDAGAPNTSVTIDDSLGRVRQTQSPSPQGGRLIDDTFYDSRGWVFETYSDYYNSAEPEMALDTAETDQDIYDQDVYTYDGMGRQVEDVSQDGGQTVSTTVTVYNGDSTTTFPPIAGTLGSTVTPPYDGTIKTTETDPLGRTSKLIEYTADPTLSIPSNTNTGVFTITGGTPVTTTYGYNAANTQDETKDNAGDTSSQTYNLVGEETSSTDPDAGISTMTYDPDGNLLQSEDADGKYVSYTYDALGRKTAEYAAPSSDQVVFGDTGADESDSWIYDNANGVSGVTDAVGQATTQTSYSGGNAYVEQSLGYNNFGESLGTEVIIPSAQGSTLGKTWKFTNTYTSTIGLLFSSTLPNGGGLPLETTTPSYVTGLDLPSGLGSTVDGYGAGSSYDDYGRLQQDAIGNGIAADDGAVTYSYDLHNGELTDQLVTTNGSGTSTDVDDNQYTYDADGLTTGETDTRAASTATAENQCYTYTTQDQLSQAWTTTAANCDTVPSSGSHSTVGDNLSAASAYDETWTYNAAGDQATETAYSPSSGQTQTTTDCYDGNATSSESQPTTLTGTSTTTCGSSGTSTTAYTYNDDGQQTTRSTSTGDQSLSWDNQGQLTAVTNTTTTTDSSYIYDASGNLLLETDGSDTTLYLPSEQITVNSSGTVVSSARYYTLPGGITVVRTGLTTNYDFEIASDQHGTNTLFLNHTTQTPTWRQFDPYGNVRGTAQTWLDNRGFLDDPDDSTTELTDVGARWYDPTTGSFISVDPVLETSDPTELGGYDYAGNDPVSSSDPTGDKIAEPEGGNGSTCTTYGPWAPGSGCGPSSGSDGGSGGGTTSNTDDNSSSSSSNSSSGGCSNWFSCSWHSVTHFVAKHITAIAVTAGVVAFVGCMFVPGVDLLCAAAGDAAIGQLGGDAVGITSALGAAGSTTVGATGAAGAVGGGTDLLEDELNDGASVSAAGAGGCLGGQSFTPSTKVLLATGTAVAIDKLKTGDKVEAHNTATGKNETQTVDAVLLNHDTNLYDLTVTTAHGKEVLHTTSSHPFWDATTHTWVDAGKLRAGDRLQTADASTTVANNGHTPTASTGWMWDLTISNDHDFYVVAGTTAVLVHNCSSNQGVYQFDDQLNPGKTYVGKSMNLTARLQYWVRQGRLSSMEDAQCLHVCGTEDDVFAAEHQTMVRLQQQGVQLSNGIASPGKAIINQRKYVQEPLF